jgi:ABC-type uncharacterized transport system substrate-binding protein
MGDIQTYSEERKCPFLRYAAEVCEIEVTFFPDQKAKKQCRRSMTLPELRDLIQNTTKPAKDKLPWLKLATFGDKRSDKNCFRHNANVLSITGVELDYDDEWMTLDAAVEIAERARLQALFYTSARYSDATPRWRMLLPTSEPLPPADRAKLVARVNGLYGGVFSPESFTLSQSYYYGAVGKNPNHRAVITEGDYVDLRPDLDAGAIGKNGKGTSAPGGELNPFLAYGLSRHPDPPPPVGKVAAALAAIPNDDKVDRALWIDIGMSVKAATGGSDEGLQPAMPVIGVMSPQSAATAVRNIAAFRNGLRELGYTEGRSIRIEYRFAEGVAERFPALIADLVNLKPAVILVGSIGAILAARTVTQTTPLIMFAAANPVTLGLAESFARPGGNVTGFLSASDAGIVGKRLELLREAVPSFSRLGALVVPDDAAADGTLSALPQAARRLGLDARIYEVRSAAEVEATLAGALRDGMQALYVAQSPIFIARRAEIIAKAAGMRLPTIYFFREFVQAGGLMSYSTDLADMYRRAATYADKILSGANPGELPLQSSDKYELAINFKTAKALGLTISEAFLLRADEVIE